MIRAAGTSSQPRPGGNEQVRFEVGSTFGVTARFSAKEPLPLSLGKRRLDESYSLTQLSGRVGKTVRSSRVKKTTAQRTSKKKVPTKNPEPS